MSRGLSAELDENGNAKEYASIIVEKILPMELKNISTWEDIKFDNSFNPVEISCQSWQGEPNEYIQNLQIEE